MGGCHGGAYASPLVFGGEGGWERDFYFCGDGGGHGLLLFRGAVMWNFLYLILYELMGWEARKKLKLE